VAAAFLLSSGQASASPINEFYIRQALDRYFTLPRDADTLATAGSSAMTCSDSDCMFLNPAGLGEVEDIQLSTSLGFSLLNGQDFFTEEHLEQNEYIGDVILGFPLGTADPRKPRYGTLTLAYSRYDGHTDDMLHTTPDGHRRSLAYGISPSDELSLGYSFTFYDDQLHNDFSDLHSHSRLLHIWGIQYRPDKKLEIGSTFSLGIGQSDTTDFRFDSNGLSHLRSYSGNIGVTGDLAGYRVSASADYTRVESRGNLDGVAPPVVIGGDESGNIYNVRVGAEKPLSENFSARAGLRYEEVESYKFHREDLADLSGQVRGPAVALGIQYRIPGSYSHQPAAVLSYGVERLFIGDGVWQHLLTLKVPLSHRETEDESSRAL
jgi:hypothetical protein